MKTWGLWAATSAIASVAWFSGHGQGQGQVPEEPVPELNGVPTHRMGASQDPPSVERVFKFRPARTEAEVEGRKKAHFHMEPNKQGEDSMESR